MYCTNTSLEVDIKEVESHVVLGYGCNHNCKHCVVQVKRSRILQSGVAQDLSPDESVVAIKKAIENGATKIVFTGGEPTLRPDLPNLVALSLSCGCKVQIQTNGSKTRIIERILLENQHFKDKIEYMIPIHSTDPDHNDFICGCKGGLENALNSIKFIASNNGNLIGKIVLTKYTNDLPSLCKIYDDNRAKYVIIAYPHCASFPIDVIREIDLECQQSKTILKNLYQYSFNTPIILQAFPRCFIGDIPSAIIQEEQSDFLDLQIVEHKYKSENGNLWHTYRKLDKKKMRCCVTCKYNQICEGIWKDYIRAYGD